MFIKANSLKDVYNILSRRIFDESNEYNIFTSNPRGMETKELVGNQIIIENPRERLVYNENRKFSIVYAVIESLLLFAKVDDVRYYAEFNKNMENYSDDGLKMHGAYGYRIAGSINDIVEKLKSDRDSRQAVLTIYNHDKDLTGYNGKDVPCTLSLQFILRENKLDLITTMRSNDIILGLPYDVYNFTTLQEIIANTLHVQIGRYIHQVGSLHVYKENYEMLKSMKNCKSIVAYNNNDIHTWEMQAKNYIDFIDGKKVLENNFFDNHFNVILNEFEHKNKRKPIHKCPGFVEPFTKRWRQE